MDPCVCSPLMLRGRAVSDSMFMQHTPASGPSYALGVLCMCPPHVETTWCPASPDSNNPCSSLSLAPPPLLQYNRCGCVYALSLDGAFSAYWMQVGDLR